MKYKMACPNTNAGDMEYINDSYSALFLESLMIDQFFFLYLMFGWGDWLQSHTTLMEHLFCILLESCLVFFPEIRLRL